VWIALTPQEDQVFQAVRQTVVGVVPGVLCAPVSAPVALGRQRYVQTTKGLVGLNDTCAQVGPGGSERLNGR